MRTGMITLVMAMGVGTVMSAACDRQEQRVVVVPEASKAEPNGNAASSVPKVAMAPPTAAEQKEGAMPTQGEVDPKDPVQRRDFETQK
jgi:hypothetical protein